MIIGTAVHIIFSLKIKFPSFVETVMIHEIRCEQSEIIHLSIH